jgi:hypothetical protein
MTASMAIAISRSIAGSSRTGQPCMRKVLPSSHKADGLYSRVQLDVQGRDLTLRVDFEHHAARAIEAMRFLDFEKIVLGKRPNVISGSLHHGSRRRHTAMPVSFCEYCFLTRDDREGGSPDCVNGPNATVRRCSRLSFRSVRHRVRADTPGRGKTGSGGVRYPGSQQIFAKKVPRERSDRDDVDDILKRTEVVGIACVEGQVVGSSGGCNQQVGNARTTGLPGGSSSCEQAAVHSRSLFVEGYRIPRRGSPLQSVLPSGAFFTLVSGSG